MTGRLRVLAALVLSAAAAAGLACGGDDGGESGAPSAQRNVRLRVGETAGIPYAFLKFGVDKGFYRRAGLDVAPVAVQGAAPIVTALVSGDYQLGGSDTGTFTQALARGVPLTMVAPGTSVSPRGAEDFSAVVVSRDSKIEEPGDLRGRNVAVNILNNIGEVALGGALQRLGVSPEGIRYSEVPFPEMVAAVQRRRVDAALVIEPFRTIGASAGLRTVLRPFSGFRPGLQIGSIVATEQYARENAEVVGRFQRAHAQAARYVASHEAEFRRALPRIAQLEEPLAERVNLPVWRERVDPVAVDRVADAMARFGMVDEKPDVRAAIAPGA